MHELKAKLIVDTKSALVDRRVTNARLGVGSILLLEFGAKSDTESGAYMRIECSWRIERGDEVLVACEDDRERLRERVGELNGRVVQDAEVSVPGLDVELALEGQYRLRIFPIYAEHVEYENWTVHTPEQMALIAGPGREVRCTRVEE